MTPAAAENVLEKGISIATSTHSRMQSPGCHRPPTSTVQSCSAQLRCAASGCDSHGCDVSVVAHPLALPVPQKAPEKSGLHDEPQDRRSPLTVKRTRARAPPTPQRELGAGSAGLRSGAGGAGSRSGPAKVAHPLAAGVPGGPLQSFFHGVLVTPVSILSRPSSIPHTHTVPRLENLTHRTQWQKTCCGRASLEQLAVRGRCTRRAMSFLGEPSAEPPRGGAGAAGYPSTPKDPRGDVGTLFCAATHAFGTRPHPARHRLTIQDRAADGAAALVR